MVSVLLKNNMNNFQPDDISISKRNKSWVRNRKSELPINQSLFWNRRNNISRSFKTQKLQVYQIIINRIFVFSKSKELYVLGRCKLGLNGYKNNSIRNNKCDICQTKQHTDILVWKRYYELFWKSRSVQLGPKLTAVKGEVNKSYGKAAWSKRAEDSQLNELLRSHWCLYNSYNSPRLNYEKAFVWNRNMSHFCLFVYLDLN